MHACVAEHPKKRWFTKRYRFLWIEMLLKDHPTYILVLRGSNSFVDNQLPKWKGFSYVQLCHQPYLLPVH